MGSFCSKSFDFEQHQLSKCDSELREIKSCLALLLKQLNPDELLTFVTKDKEIYEICRDDPHLRANCIVGAIRRYHCEKFFYEAVHNRSADYMVMLDFFLDIQDEYERQQDLRMEQLQRRSAFMRCICGNEEDYEDSRYRQEVEDQGAQRARQVPQNRQEREDRQDRHERMQAREGGENREPGPAGRQDDQDRQVLVDRQNHQIRREAQERQELLQRLDRHIRRSDQDRHEILEHLERRLREEAPDRHDFQDFPDGQDLQDLQGRPGRQDRQGDANIEENAF